MLHLFRRVTKRHQRDLLCPHHDQCEFVLNSQSSIEHSLFLANSRALSFSVPQALDLTSQIVPFLQHKKLHLGTFRKNAHAGSQKYNDPAVMAAITYDKAAMCYNSNDRTGLQQLLLLKSHPSYQLPALDMRRKEINFTLPVRESLLKIERNFFVLHA